MEDPQQQIMLPMADFQPTHAALAG